MNRFSVKSASYGDRAFRELPEDLDKWANATGFPYGLWVCGPRLSGVSGLAITASRIRATGRRVRIYRADGLWSLTTEKWQKWDLLRGTGFQDDALASEYLLLEKQWDDLLEVPILAVDDWYVTASGTDTDRRWRAWAQIFETRVKASLPTVIATEYAPGEIGDELVIESYYCVHHTHR
jgi:hypothetical protein